MSSTFRKISRVGSLSGATNWYLSDDCLLAAKRTLYVVQYRRFYLHDLGSIQVWPSSRWMLRPIIPGVLLLVLGGLLWHWVNLATGAVFGGLGLAWALLELALGPTALARIQTTGATVDLPLVKRMRRADRVLSKIDAAVLVVRGDLAKITPGPTELVPSNAPALNNSEAGDATAALGDAS